jgi:hypothetical protein
LALPEVTLGPSDESTDSSSPAAIYDPGIDEWAGVDTGNYDGEDYGDDGLLTPGGCPIYCLPYETDSNEGPEYTETPYPYSSALPYATDPTDEPDYTPGSSLPSDISYALPTPVSSFSTSSEAYTILQRRQATPTAGGGFAAFQ